MRVLGLAFAGIETEDSEAVATFLAETLGVERLEEGGVHSFGFADGTALAVIPPSGHLEGQGTVVGFLVDDVEAATAELVERGVRLEGPLLRSATFRWQHFSAPNGHKFELLDRNV